MTSTWTDERLDRFADKVDRIAGKIDQQGEQIGRLIEALSLNCLISKPRFRLMQLKHKLKVYD